MIIKFRYPVGLDDIPGISRSSEPEYTRYIPTIYLVGVPDAPGARRLSLSARARAGPSDRQPGLPGWAQAERRQNPGLGRRRGPSPVTLMIMAPTPESDSESESLRLWSATPSRSRTTVLQNRSIMRLGDSRDSPPVTVTRPATWTLQG
jgi:hypothetical protein